MPAEDGKPTFYAGDDAVAKEKYFVFWRKLDVKKNEIETFSYSLLR